MFLIRFTRIMRSIAYRLMRGGRYKVSRRDAIWYARVRARIYVLMYTRLA